MKKKNIELVAPAGNFLKMKTALAFGAGAVYLGLPDFSLRVRINDFNLKSLAAAVDYAHSLDKKAYVTLNIFAHNRHLKRLPQHLKALNNIKPDAIILSDPGVLSLVKKYCPKTKLHLSTQANCTNYEAVKFWQKQGISRIILGRETSLAEIKEIHRLCPKMELEYFVHGAMCLAYSGRCLLSKSLVGRSANLGDCVQPCRFSYEVSIKAEGQDQELELVEERHGSYLLNSKDLCLIKYLPDLIKAGVSSFKIEGRAKSVYYLANVCGLYTRANLEAEKIDFLFKELQSKISNRGYTTGFLLGKTAQQNTACSHFVPSWEFCGQVLASVFKTDQNGGVNRLRIKVHNSIKTGDRIEIVLPKYDIIKTKVGKIIEARSREEIKEAHGGGGGQEIILEVKSDLEIPVYAVLRKKR